MHRIIVVASLTVALALTAAPAGGQEEPIESVPVPMPTPTPAPVLAPVIVKSVKHTPKRRVVKHKRFDPWARPVGAQVHKIIALEAERWGASQSRLSCRIRGESGYRWWIPNGQYVGLGQFASSTFYRGMASIGSRRVKMVSERQRFKRSWWVHHYSDGSRRVTRGGRHLQTVVVKKKGTIPRWPERTHGWAQVRIMARAMVGLGNVYDSEWEVRC